MYAYYPVCTRIYSQLLYLPVCMYIKLRIGWFILMSWTLIQYHGFILASSPYFSEASFFDSEKLNFTIHLLSSVPVYM